MPFRSLNFIFINTLFLIINSWLNLRFPHVHCTEWSNTWCFLISSMIKCWWDLSFIILAIEIFIPRITLSWCLVLSVICILIRLWCIMLFQLRIIWCSPVVWYCYGSTNRILSKFRSTNITSYIKICTCINSFWALLCFRFTDAIVL